MNVLSLAKKEDALLAEMRVRYNEYCAFGESAVDLIQDLLGIASDEGKFVDFVAFTWPLCASLIMRGGTTRRKLTHGGGILINLAVDPAVVSHDFAGLEHLVELRPHAGRTRLDLPEGRRLIRPNERLSLLLCQPHGLTPPLA